MRLFFSTLFLFYCLIVGPITVWASDERDAFLTSAKGYLDKNERPAAIIELKNLLQTYPNHVEGRLLLGNAYLQLEYFPEAEKEFDRARTLNASRDDWLLPMGRAYIHQLKFDVFAREILINDQDSDLLKAGVLALRGQMSIGEGDSTEAEVLFIDALSLDADQVEALLGLATLNLASKDYSAAADFASKALKYDVYTNRTLILSGDLAQLMGDGEDARQRYSEAIVRDPTDVRGHLGLTSVYLSNKDLVGARKAIDKARKLGSANLLTYYMHAYVLFKEGSAKEAEAALLEVIKGAPNHPASNLLIGIIYYQAGSLNSALEFAQRYHELKPKNGTGNKLLASVLSGLGEHEKVVALLEETLSEHQLDSQWFALLGSAYLETGSTIKGNQYLEKAVELNPDNPRFKTRLALGYYSAGAKSDAIELLDGTTTENPDLSSAKVLLVISNMREGRFQAAADVARKIVEADPKSPVGYNLLGSAALAMGETASAVEWFRKATEVDADYYPAWMNLAKLSAIKQNYADAQKIYLRILDVDDTNIEAMLALANLLSQQNLSEDPLKWFVAAHELDPGDITAGVQLSSYYLASGAPIEALSVARTLVGKNPKNAYALHQMARSYMATDQFGSATVIYLDLLNDHPESIELLSELASAQMKNGADADAILTAKRFLEIEPGSVRGLTLEIHALANAGKTEEALQASRALQDAHSDLATGFQLEGDLLKANNDFPGAALAYQRAYELAPSGLLATVLSKVHLTNGDASEAISILVDWVKKAPDDTVVRMQLAMGYQSRSQNEKAIQQYESLISIDSDNALALNNLAWLYRESNAAKALQSARRAHALAPENIDIADTLGWILVEGGDMQEGISVLRRAASNAPDRTGIQYHLGAAMLRTVEADRGKKLLFRLLRDYPSFPERDATKKLLGQK